MILPGDIFWTKKGFDWKSLSAWFFSATGVLVFLNVVVFFLVSVEDPTQNQLESDFNYLKQPSNLQAMQSMHLQAQDPILKDEVEQKTKYDPYLFTKDLNFWTRAQKMNFIGDQVQIGQNKLVLKHLDQVFSQSNQKVYGISANTGAPTNWITYQFTHASLFHLFSNVAFLFLIAMVLQTVVSAEWIIVTYILSGMTGALFYMLFGDQFSLPLVGASGSVSGLIAFLCTIKAQENIKWSYFVSPLKGGYGILYMPAYLLFPMYLLSDFTQVLINTHGVTQSVAHSAHVGGAFCGFFMGLTYHLSSHFSSKFSTQ